MICIECSNPDIKCLYSDFKSKYIQLTVCARCDLVADRYVEYDKVILFLDVLLLRPQAYRHAAYNLVEQGIFSDISESKTSDAEVVADNMVSTENGISEKGNTECGVETDTSDQVKTSRFSRYSKLRRYLVLSILFEVYLEWAYEEKSAWNSQLISHVLQAPPLWQYLFFILQQCIGKLTFCLVMVFCFTHVLKWGSVQNTNLPPDWNLSYHRCVLMLTILMSLAVKSLPIIMLIWPYDNAAVANTVVSILGIFNNIEALKVITNLSYGPIFGVALVSNVILLLTQQLAMSFLIGLISGHSPVSLFEDECKVTVFKVARVFELFTK